MLRELSFGFHYLNLSPSDPNIKNSTNSCPIASDLMIEMAIGGIFDLFFLGVAYGLTFMIANGTSIEGKAAKWLIGM
ncbi:unnamed protein product [Didymodactylos carnosus]|uniref:Uncharacterized protein n=1 Tax=Didymodactylos carnosus TaxID=1234261 RepID=A0A813SX66_9BILA|nr:unnamed protein product [Didymodactylos carnosus]CAF0805919.1 unnamed protein product [Didymodactylos carnosus]CAF3495771.1 unnamed protein product [Didymodactylos carnosus]CAF3591328.1 unnamed protein product [Didymodactylos carnosus]